MTNSSFQLSWTAPLKVLGSWLWRTLGIMIAIGLNLFFIVVIAYVLAEVFAKDELHLASLEERIDCIIDFALEHITYIIYLIVSYFTFKMLNGVKYKEFSIEFPAPNTFMQKGKLFIVAYSPELISLAISFVIPATMAETRSYLFLDSILVTILCYYVILRLLTRGLFGQKFVVIPTQKNSFDSSLSS